MKIYERPVFTWTGIYGYIRSIRMETITIEIDDEIFIHLAVLAHEREMTLNDLIVQLLREQIERNPTKTIDIQMINGE